MTSFLDAGWKQLSGFASTHEATQVVRSCHALLALPEEERRVGDKPHAGTHHLVELDRRIPQIDALLKRLEHDQVIAAFVGGPFERLQVSYRSPQPGFGAQKLHTDALPKFDDGRCTIVTAIVPLVDFTSANGATRVVPGSHRRRDLQRLAGNLDAHDDAILLTGSAGSAFVFSGHLLHSGTQNQSEHERPALQLQWQRR